MQKPTIAFTALILVFLVAVSSVAIITPLLDASPHPFYVGVTYCGDSVEEAKQLIDKVSNYTNLFVLQSGTFLYNNKAIEEIGDYAVDSGLNVILYCGGGFMANNLSVYGWEHWGDHFLGIYFLDEPGGKTIDKMIDRFGSANYLLDGSVQVNLYSDYPNTFNSDTIKSTSTSCDARFYLSGEIEIALYVSSLQFLDTEYGKELRSQPINSSCTKYYPNGTILKSEQEIHNNKTVSYIYQPDGTVQDQEGNPVTDQGNITQFQSYQELKNLNPLGTYAKIAAAFNNATLIELKKYSQIDNQTLLNQTMSRLFTSDYALYWFDYKAGYPTVFAEFVGNESRERHIALCRGAAETLGKDWGVMVTWKYNQLPYLESGNELYCDLALAYSSGAKYGIVFTYPNVTAYGTLTDDHFEALQRFWITLQTHPSSFGNAESKAAYIIPADYGFGFRSANDTIWGRFPADELSMKIYSDTVALTARYGARFNILYDGVETAAKLGDYSAVYYYNQTIT